MYCICSNSNNYEVINLCDVKKFTNKNGPFINSAWTQIALTDILKLPSNCVNIEKIEKIYINVNITSNKIIKTPKSSSANSEGLILTGRKLLIDGYFCIKIVYTSLTKEQSIYSVNFNVPFCTYIVIEENVDPLLQVYCVKSCIEDVFASLINCNTIFFYVTLFLVAFKINFACNIAKPINEDCTINLLPPPLPPPSPPKPNQIKNSIILYSFDTSEEIVKVEFHTSNMTLYATSSGKIYNKGGNLKILDFYLVDGASTSVNANGAVLGNNNGNDFVSNLDNQLFAFGDIVYLLYTDSSQITVTNFPKDGENYKMLSTKAQSFKITRNGLEENIFPQIITLKDVNNNLIVKIKFDILAKRILFESTGNIANPSFSAQDYFVLTLLDSNNSVIKRVGKIIGGADSFNLSKSFTDEKFSDNDILKLDYIENTKVEIINFPNVGSQPFNPTWVSKSFRITPTALVDI